jgi:hypothetical protein
MSYGDRDREQSVAAAYEALNASYRMMDEYMRQGQRVAEQMWMPWMRPFIGSNSPFIPPEEWVRAYRNATMTWLAMAQQWTSFWGLTPPGSAPGPQRGPLDGGPPTTPGA